MNHNWVFVRSECGAVLHWLMTSDVRGVDVLGILTATKNLPAGMQHPTGGRPTCIFNLGIKYPFFLNFLDAGIRAHPPRHTT